MTASKRLYLLILIGAVPLAFSGVVPAGATVGTIYDIALIMTIIADYLLTQRPHFLDGSRSVAERLSVGRQNSVSLDIYNHGASPLHLKVRDDHPPEIDAGQSEFEFDLKSGAKATLTYTLYPRRRGNYAFGQINVRYLSLLGLFWRSRSIAARREVRVFSDLKALRDLSVRLSHSSELGDLHQKRRGHGTDFSSLREYTAGDDMRRIDWSATARRDRPIVRTYEAEQEQNLLILIDAGRMMVSDLEGLSRFDHALNAALSLALAGLTRNDQVAVGVFADRPILYLPPRRGKIHMNRLIEAVFDLKPKMVEPDYVGILSYFAGVQKGRSLMVVLTDLTDPTGSQTLLAGLASLSPRHLPFCVTLKDRQVDRVAASDAHDIESIYRRAVATDLIAQRELALSVLTRRGCLVLDCPPQELSESLVDRYLDIKARGRL